MKIKFILAFSLSVAALHFNAQVTDKVSTAKENEPNKTYLSLIDKTITNFEKRASDLKLLNQKPPDQYNLQEYIATMDPNTGAIYNNNFVTLENDIKAGRYLPTKNMEMFAGVAGATDKALGDQWIERGPYEVSGRIRGFMFDPNDPTGKKVWAGGVSGGLWYNNDITNAASEWTLVDAFWNNTSISCIVADPNNPKIFYVGTGEVETGDISGLGIWRTTDGGLTWSHVLNTDGPISSNSIKTGVYGVPVIKILNNNGNSEIYAGVAGSYTSDNRTFFGLNEVGLYKSTNGTSFTKLSSLNVPNSSRGYDIQDVEIGSDKSIWVSTRRSYFGGVSGGKIFKSTNNGSSFTQVYDVGNMASRVMIEISETNPNKVYALLEGGSGEPLRIAKTTDGGSTWISTATANSGITLPKPIDTGQPANDFTRSQAFYDLVIEADPQNDDHLYVGGIDSYKSTNGGLTWTQYTKWSNNNQLSGANISMVHADQHSLTFNPKNPNQFVLTNDGGVFYGANKNALVGPTAVQARNKRLNVTQFYHGTLNPVADFSNEEMLLGAQDNGSQVLYGAANTNNFYQSDEAYGGDGAYTAYANDDKYFIASYVYNFHYVFKPTGMSSLISGSTAQNAGQFINPLVLDRNLDIAYTNANGNGSAIELHRISGLSTPTFTRAKILIASAANGVGITKMIVSPFAANFPAQQSSTLFVGLTSGKIYKVTNANTASPIISQFSYNFPGYISDIRLGATEQEIMVTVSNFNVESVFYSTDGGLNWSNKEGNLPDIPVKAIFMNPYNKNEVILGTYYGVWGSVNFQSANPTWTLYSSGLGKFKISHFDFRATDNTILAVTYGRGAFTTRIVNNTLGTTGFSHSIIENKVYPNPTRGPIQVSFDTKKHNLVDVEVFDASGKKVFEKKRVKADEEFNIGTLPKGNYILSFSENGKQIYSSTVLKR